jgi:hypothetical protein
MKNKQIRKEKKEKISQILEEISLVLQDTANKLKVDEYPHGNCVVMEKLSLDLEKKLQGEIPDEDIKYLIDGLIQSSKLEKEFSFRKDPETIPEIERASGEFKTMSMLLTIS